MEPSYDILAKMIDTIIDKLRLDSQFFVLNNGTLEEWYKVRGCQERIEKNSVAHVSADRAVTELVDNDKPLMLDRRRDLGGITLRGVYVDTKPFFYQDGDVFKGIMYEVKNFPM